MRIVFLTNVLSSPLSQGYAVADEEINMSLDEFKQQFARAGSVVDRASLGFWAHLRNDPATSIYIYFCDERSVGVQHMKKHAFFTVPLTGVLLGLTD